jgi:hypothetical protein
LGRYRSLVRFLSRTNSIVSDQEVWMMALQEATTKLQFVVLEDGNKRCAARFILSAEAL